MSSKREKRKTYRKPTSRKKTGRPPKKFNLAELKKLAQLGCTDEELADWFDCSTKTIERRRKDDEDFCRVLKKGAAELKKSLRRVLWYRAQYDNSAAAAIFLAKNYLGMSDNPDPIVSQDVEPEDLVLGVDKGPDGSDSVLVSIQPGCTVADVRAQVGLDATPPPPPPDDVANTEP